MECVTKRLGGKEMSRVPSDRWVARVLREADFILSKQLAEKMGSERQMTLTTDSATHNNVSFLGAQVHFQDGTSYTMGNALTSAI